MSDLFTGNIFDKIPDASKEERFSSIFSKKDIRVERIISEGQSTPPGEWLEEDMDEWVLLLDGEAELFFADVSMRYYMKPGDYVYIASHRRHRVDRTSPSGKTVWLAVHFK